MVEGRVRFYTSSISERALRSSFKLRLPALDPRYFPCCITILRFTANFLALLFCSPISRAKGTYVTYVIGCFESFTYAAPLPVTVISLAVTLVFGGRSVLPSCLVV